MKRVLGLKIFASIILAIAFLTLCLTSPVRAANTEDINQLLTNNFCVTFLWKPCDLSGADLRGVQINEANLSGANLRGANLEGAKLKNANLAGADLTQANLVNTELVGIDLSRANLTEADLSGSRLRLCLTVLSMNNYI